MVWNDKVRKFEVSIYKVFRIIQNQRESARIIKSLFIKFLELSTIIESLFIKFLELSRIIENHREAVNA